MVKLNFRPFLLSGSRKIIIRYKELLIFHECILYDIIFIQAKGDVFCLGTSKHYSSLYSEVLQSGVKLYCKGKGKTALRLFAINWSWI
ncbi:hypothetical protein CDQ83_12485 [Clostridium thermosuccinogenes]|nr:hypothetical protein CDQ83_12485 [Pseudoclostridium thermosuccinogenes]